jgi:hypothetical protein
MPTINKCVNGHQFDTEKYNECPYCPKTSLLNDASSINKTDTSMNKTVVGDKTAYSGSEKTMISSSQGAINETIVTTGNKTGVHQGTKIFGLSNPAQERKLVGFLVSYDLDEQGKSFPLFEGKNLVGSDRGCDIVIENIPAVSAKHLTILYRKNLFLFKDEFSTNGTYIDGEMQSEGHLDKECVIMIGGVRFYFIMVPFHLLSA